MFACSFIYLFIYLFVKRHVLVTLDVIICTGNTNIFLQIGGQDASELTSTWINPRIWGCVTIPLHKRRSNNIFFFIVHYLQHI